MGLDPQIDFIPPELIEACVHFDDPWERMANVFLLFNQGIIDAVAPYVVAVKPNCAFYEGSYHLTWALERTIQYARSKSLLVITDGKRGDGGDSARAYAQAHIGEVDCFGQRVATPMRTDALTIHGYIADACVDHFVQAIALSGTGCFVVDKTSFKPSSCIELLRVESGLTVWEELASCTRKWGEGVLGENGYSNVGVVMGATYPGEAVRMRELLPSGIFLIPGYGAQGGGADGAVVSFNRDGFGGVVVSARDVIAAHCKLGGPFNSPSAEFAVAAGRAAEYAQDDLNGALVRAGKCAW